MKLKKLYIYLLVLPNFQAYGEICIHKSLRENEKILFNAAQNGQSKRISAVIKSGVSVDIQDEKGYTPLHFATEGNRVQIVEILLEKGANYGIKNKDGKTPLDIAREKNFKDIAEKIESFDGYKTRLFNAVKSSNELELKEVAKNISSLRLIDENKETPLTIAFKAGDTSIARVLLELDPKLASIKDGDGNLPAHLSRKKDTEFN